MTLPSEVDDGTPAAVSTVNLITQTITMGDGAGSVNEVVSASGTDIALPSEPVTGTMNLYKNGQLLTPGVDYTQVGTAVTLLVAAVSDDVYVASFLSISP